MQKFRSVEDMARATIIVPPSEGFERFARHCARYFALAPVPTPLLGPIVDPAAFLALP